MKITFELTKDQHNREVVTVKLDGDWPTPDQCSKTQSEGGPHIRNIAGSTAGRLLGRGQYASPIDEYPDADGCLIYRGGAVTR